MRNIVGVVAGALCALAIACAAGAKSAMPPPAAAFEPTPGSLPQSQRQQIDAYDKEIATAREKMGLGPPPVMPPCVGEACTQRMTAAAPAADSCHHGASETCTMSCTLANSICENAQKICDIAKQLENKDAYANGKCASGQTSCKEASERCCGCQ